MSLSDRVGSRGGTFYSHLRVHLWGMLFFGMGFLAGASAAVRYR